jgi:hypothetical protein
MGGAADDFYRGLVMAAAAGGGQRRDVYCKGGESHGTRRGHPFLHFLSSPPFAWTWH